MTCKGGVCKPKNKPGKFTSEVHKTKEEAYEKGLFEGKQQMIQRIGEEVCSASETAYESGYQNGSLFRLAERVKVASVAIITGILLGGIVSAVIFSFFI